MWQITIDGPGYLGATFLLPEGVTTVGRAEENDIVLTGTAVSRRHAHLEVKDGQLYCEDLGSRNGSKVNQRPLKGTTPLRPGDVIQLGENALIVRQPARVENLILEHVEKQAGGVARRRGDVAKRVLVRREVTQSVALRAIENLQQGLSGSGSFKGPHPILLLLSETAERVTDGPTLQRALDEALEVVKTDFNATTLAILLRHKSGGLVPVAMGTKEGVLQSAVDIIDDVVDLVLSEGQAIAYNDAEPGASSGSKPTENQVLCAPVHVKGKRQGVIFINRTSQLTEELPKQLDYLNAIGELVGTALDKAHLQDGPRNEARLRQMLERFHAPHIVEKRTAELLQQGRTTLTSMQRANVAVLIADISGFTALSQALTEDRVVDLLNEFYDLMTRVIFSFEGTVDKFMGDSVMALFGAPDAHRDSATRATRAALGLRLEWERAMNRRPGKERSKLQMGLAYGEVLVGVVGATARLDYTAIGEPVNLAAWLAASADPGQILVTTELGKLAGTRFDWVPLGTRGLGKPPRKVAVVELEEEDRNRATTL